MRLMVRFCLFCSDTLQLNAGRLEPLMRIRSELREFVLRRVLDGASTTAAVDRGVNRIISEMTVLNELVSFCFVMEQQATKFLNVKNYCSVIIPFCEYR